MGESNTNYQLMKMKYNPEMQEQPYIKLNITNDSGTASRADTQLKNVHFIPSVGDLIHCDADEFEKCKFNCGNIFRVTSVIHAFDKQKQMQITINAIPNENKSGLWHQTETYY